MNLIVSNSKWEERDKFSIFNNEPSTLIDVDSMETLAVFCGAYESKSKARQAGRTGEIPKGYNEIWLNKTILIYLWNPTKYTFEFNE